MGEKSLIASCLKSRAAYERVSPLIKDGTLSEQGALVYKHIKEYYDRDPVATAVAIDLLVNAVCREISNPKHKAVFAELIKSLASSDVSPENVVADYVSVQREAAGLKLAASLSSNKPYSEIEPLMDAYSAWSRGEIPAEDDVQEAVVLRAAPIADLVRTSYADGQLIQVWPKALNDRLDGGVLRGHHIVAFAVPEAGKTLFAINAMYGFLQQGLVVLYCGNEDPVEDIILRAVTRLAERTKYEVLGDPDEAERIALGKGYENLVLASLTPGTPREIETLVEEYKPDVLIVDQIRNLHVGVDDPVMQMDLAVKAMRRIGKKHKVVVLSITQAADSADGKAVLAANDVYYSNTACAAQADVMVGIGGTQEDFTMNRRVLSLPKNKRSGDHSWFPVQIDPTMNKIRGLA